MNEDPVYSFLSGKLRIVEAVIDQINYEVEDRERLLESHVEEIDRTLCEQKEWLHQVAPHGSAPFTVGDSKRRGSIEKEIAALEAERRREQSGTWKDVASLKKELRLLLRERDEEKRRQQVIEP